MDGISSTGGGGGDRQRSQLSGDASTGQWKNSTKADAERVDRISQLPHHVQHSILSFLPSNIDVIRTSVLSKSWLSTYTSFPINRFSFSDFDSLQDLSLRDMELKFIGFVNDSLVRQCHRNSGISKFGVYFPLMYPFELGLSVDHWIGLVAENGVNYLDLDVMTYARLDYIDMDENFYTLPRTIFFANRLTVLKLTGWNCTALTTPFDPKVITWPSLQKLHMKNCYVEDTFFDFLTFGCPFIEELKVSCYGLENIQLSGFSKLRKLKVSDLNAGIMKIEINALSLQTFDCECCECEDIDLTGCENLEVLNLYSWCITGQKCQDLVSKLPALKSLVLNLHSLEKIKISGQQLEKLVIDFCIAELVLDAPRLQSFQDFHAYAPVFLVNPPSLPKVVVHKHIEPDLFVSHFLKLRVFLSSLKQIECLKLWLIDAGPFLWLGPGDRPLPVEDLSNISPPPFHIVKHLELHFSRKSKGVKGKGDRALVDRLFLACRPESLLLWSGWQQNNDVIKALCEDLMQQGKCDHCCSSTCISCWRRELKGYEIEQFEKDGDRKALTCEALIKSLQTLGPKQKVNFILSW